jgi:hypothetical protein
MSFTLVHSLKLWVSFPNKTVGSINVSKTYIAFIFRAEMSQVVRGDHICLEDLDNSYYKTKAATYQKKIKVILPTDRGGL